MSLLLLFFPRRCRKSLPVPGIRSFTFPHAWKFWSLEPGEVSLQGPDFYGREESKMSYSRDRKTFPAYGNAKGLLPGTRRVFWHGGCERDLWLAGKMSWYQQRDFQSLVMQFSGGKLKQKGFFHSAMSAEWEIQLQHRPICLLVSHCGFKERRHGK